MPAGSIKTIGPCKDGPGRGDHCGSDSHSDANQYADDNPCGNSPADSDPDSHSDANQYADGNPYGNPPADSDCNSQASTNPHPETDQYSHNYAYPRQ